MKRSVFVAAVLVLAALTATAPAASAQNVSGSLEVASKNTTDSDFQNATVSGGSISGSGEAADVVLVDGTSIDGFEDGDINIETSGFSGWGGQTSALSAQTGTVLSGQYSGELTVSNSFREVEFGSSTTRQSSLSFSVQTDNTGSGSDRPAQIAVRNAANANTFALLRHTPGGDVKIINGGADPTIGSWSPGVAYEYTLEFDFQNDELTVVRDGTTLGTAAFLSSATAWDTVKLAADSSSSGQTINTYVDDFRTGSGSDTAEYRAEHTVEDAEQAFANLSISDAEAKITVEENTSGTWSSVASTTVASSDNHTLDISAATSSNLRTTVAVSSVNSGGSIVLHDEGILFDAAAPTIDDGSASPTGNLQQPNQTLSINASDADFGLAQGDNVNVTFEAKPPDESNFSAVGSETLSANGTANTSLTADVGGTWEWRATVTDSYGKSAGSQTFSFSAPATLEIRNESAPAQLVQTSEPVRVEFYFDLREDPQIITRNTTDGELNLTGLPNNQPFTIVVDGGDKYVSRRIFVENIYQRSAVYLLPKNQTQAATVFEVSDFSGSYNQDESALIIQRALNESWQTVEGDLIGANERISTQLRVDQRHRIVILNARTGERRILGPFTPIASGTQRIQVTDDGQVQLQGLGAVATIGPDIGQLAARQTSVSGSVISQDTDVDAVTLTATYIAPDGSETELASTSASSAGDLSTQIDLTSRANGTVRVTTVYQLADGATGSTSRIYEIRSTAGTQYSLLAVLAGVPDLVPDTSAEPFKLAVSMLLTIVGTASAASAFRMSSDFVGVVAVLLLGGWAVIGWMPYTVPFAAGVAAISVAAVRRGL